MQTFVGLEESKSSSHLEVVLTEALKGCKVGEADGAAQEVAADSGIEAFALDVAWNAVAGKRAKENLKRLRPGTDSRLYYSWSPA